MVLADELRQAVLQAALQGKLTEQLDTDSNVDEFIYRIKEAKKDLVDTKEIKKEPNIADICEEEIICHIPDNWRFEKLGNLFYIERGASPRPISAYITSASDGINWIKIGDTEVGEKYVNSTKEKITKEGAEKSRAVKAGDFIFSNSMSFGRPYIMNIDGCIHDGWNVIHNIHSVNDDMKEFNQDYLYFVLSSEMLKQQIIDKAEGGVVKNIRSDNLRDLIMPIPPIEEQQRIVDKINEIMPKIDEYEKIEKELEALRKEFPTDMKDALLQAAMQGKLTEQLESDSNVDELLLSIQKEKEELIAHKKIKKEKTLPDIEAEEIPFDIPDNWRWVRWGNLAYSIQYGYNAPAQEVGKIKMVRISDIQDNSVNWDSVPYCNIEDEEIETYLLQDNDILFARTGGTVGKSFLVNGISEKAIYAGYLIRTRYNDQLVPKYLKLFMESQLYWVQLQNGKTQGCQPNCNGQTLSKMIIPIPPIEEQQRIVERLDALLPLCEDLKEN